MEKARAIATMLLAATAFAGTPAMAQQGTESKGATANTERANAAVRQATTMNDKQDFEDATRGLLAQLKDPIVKPPTAAWSGTPSAMNSSRVIRRRRSTP